MDFTLGEELEEVRGLARQIFTDHATQERIRAAETSERRFDTALWTELASAGLLGVALPEEQGGAGLGIGALAVLLEEQGRFVAPVPVWPAVVAALTLAEHGTRDDLVTAVAEGTGRLTLALEEFGPHDPAEPRCTAAGDGDGWRLTGTKAVVPTAFGTSHVLVSAATPDGPGLFLMETGAEGASWERAETTSHDAAGNLTLDGAPAEPLGDGALATALRLTRVAVTAVQIGVAEGAMRLAADYLGEREQFGRPLGTFQAVQHQLADSFIEIEAIRVSLWHAVSLIAAGEPADAAVLVAKWWADEAGLNVVHRTQHLHGGVGVDVDYPVHRYFLWGKQNAGVLGGASADLDRLGALLQEAS
ncbi:acyl-CoA dehydrogenase family protein [Spirillospora albida]|uniref:acyl-CoA dehydrogenase family protein n=1 Tax=Spirillospora albida TaxID=58123 RepID=UPI0004C08C67|nr:acyl-CoA dehydrogenase family protein [Spirillospora albida]